MLSVSSLHLGPGEVSPAQEYRIRDGSVEVRDVDPDRTADWQRLTPRQLSRHVESNTVVAQWLEHRLGWRRLLQACVGLDASSHEILSSEAPRPQWHH